MTGQLECDDAQWWLCSRKFVLKGLALGHGVQAIQSDDSQGIQSRQWQE